MGRHDQLFKDLLQAFFGDFLRIVVPGIAPRLRPGEAEFLPKEYFTARPEGRRRELDLVARVPTERGEPEVVLVHVEVEGRARASMARRLWEYSMLVGLEYEAPVLPIVLYLRGGRPDVTKETFRRELFGEELVLFHYFALGLSRSQAERYLRRPEPLAWALAALMRPGSWQPSRHKLECLRSVAKADLDDERRVLLVDCVETYLQLEDEEAARFAASLAETANREVQAMEMTWSQKLEQKGLVRGRQEGIAEGRQEGIAEGRQEGMRALVLDLIEKRFGSLPAEARRRVEAIDSPQELSRLAARVLDARSLEEMGLG
jgi:Domain of unknown function (DUF4351)